MLAKIRTTASILPLSPSGTPCKVTSGIEDGGVDLVVADRLRDALNQAGVDGEAAVSLGDAQRHFVAGRHEPPVAEFFLRMSKCWQIAPRRRLNSSMYSSPL